MCGCIVMSCSLFTVMYSTVNSDLSFYISFHRFPADPEVRAQWLIKIRRENFSPVACTRVCSRHFQTGDFAVTAGGKRTLNRGAVPCLFAWNSLVYLCLPPAIAAPDSDSEMDVQLAQDHDYCVTPTTSAVTDALSDENEALWRRVQELEHRQRVGFQLGQKQPRQEMTLTTEHLGGSQSHKASNWCSLPGNTPEWRHALMPVLSSLKLFEPHPFVFSQQDVLLNSDHGHGKCL
uniref:THAP domain-containing protein 1 n=1 Tax=Astyanax mexicanus TaxID=7994 RepID=A0A3B1JZS0_ASTMX